MSPKRIMADAFVIAGLLTLGRTASAEADFDQMAEEFSANRQALAQELSRELYLPLLPGSGPFFKAATNGPWQSVSEAYSFLQHHPDSRGFAVPVSRNKLWAPFHETMSAWKEWARWQEDSRLLSMFHHPIIASMPEDSICFGGYALMVAGGRTPTSSRCFITQNRLGDDGYVAYLRVLYGDRIRLPSQEKFQTAKQRLVDDAITRISKDGIAVNPVGSIFLPGTEEGAEIDRQLDGAIARLIFDMNKDTHAFFVEESHAIDWMYPYLEPHGQILKLNPRPSEA